ncbi:proline--tRNA ligase [Mycolicibacterium agri]|uniref:Proline--tRNA ligase n=1 Tax=Mycolicibacterium agri TaxID=36811 RepID=A0A2A7N6U9_MYCAG|nr:proline--tRNA ligase [Mycolicibacterium agri]PEG39503.1 proline--tRNA ligase [Mycolicibacterium agri]GFG48668.1 proline--tRNA ligase [Mycolicibacterium agri]
MAVLTAQHDDFPRWYQDVLTKAKLAENGPARGTMVIRPNGYAIWERMQDELDRRIKAAGARNAYFPLLMPMSFFEREAEHVEGFSPELAVVTHGGGKELTEPLAIRPTSETVIGEYMAKWVDSYRDLPLLLNQWANVVRWETRPRIFLRTTEFLWQEGHTAHAGEDDARAYARRILHDVYQDFMRNVLAVPVIIGGKTVRERFAGAVNTMTCEGIMRDGKALQMGTSHELGQRFSRAFNISYLAADGTRKLCWTTSWGSSTRMLGGLIMCHGDDFGLVLPPAVAPVQAAVVAVKETDGSVTRAAATLTDELAALGVRAQADDDVEQGFGWRATDWDLQGVPIRVEIGPRDLAQNTAVVYRRDTREKTAVAVASVADTVHGLTSRMQEEMLNAATARRDAFITDCTTLDDVRDVARTGFARVPWATVGVSGEERLAVDGLTVRCLQAADGTLPDGDDDAGAIAYVARAY